MFMKLLDDNQIKPEANAALLGVPLKNKVFKEGICVISETPHIETDYSNLRWSVFHNWKSEDMLSNIQNHVFPFIKTANGEEKKIFTATGIVRVKNNIIDFSVDSMNYQEEIDLRRAEESKERAEKRLKQKDNIDVLRAEKSLARAIARIRLAQG